MSMSSNDLKVLISKMVLSKIKVIIETILDKEFRDFCRELGCSEEDSEMMATFKQLYMLTNFLKEEINQKKKEELVEGAESFASCLFR